jgi:hypothetical protein
MTLIVACRRSFSHDGSHGSRQGWGGDVEFSWTRLRRDFREAGWLGKRTQQRERQPTCGGADGDFRAGLARLSRKPRGSLFPQPPVSVLDSTRRRYRSAGRRPRGDNSAPFPSKDIQKYASSTLGILSSPLPMENTDCLLPPLSRCSPRWSCRPTSPSPYALPPEQNAQSILHLKS